MPCLFIPIFTLDTFMNNKDYYTIITSEVTRDYQKYAWPLAERSYGIDMRYNF